MEVVMTKIEAMNKTARSNGAVGKNAIVPRIVKELADWLCEDGDDMKDFIYILDYGAGPRCKHVLQLVAEGYKHVYAWEIGANFSPYIHDEEALLQYYDIVYASNVLNVQPSPAGIEQVVAQCFAATTAGGYCVFNYPKSPRKTNTDFQTVFRIICKYFLPAVDGAGGVEVINGTVFKCQRPYWGVW
jgi:hypothetical protein